MCVLIHLQFDLSNSFELLDLSSREIYGSRTLEKQEGASQPAFFVFIKVKNGTNLVENLACHLLFGFNFFSA